MSNPVPGRFLAVIESEAPPFLDCGSGGRLQPGVISLDPLVAPGFEPGMQICGSGYELPFPDDTFGGVLSQAVLEHVEDPFAYMAEIVRVLRPGGLLYVEAAFMQPVHMAPTHYFNVTPYGLRLLCADLEILEEHRIGLLSDVFDWTLNEVGASTRVRRRVAALADEIDAAPNQWLASSGVGVLARKPLLEEG